MSTWYEGGRGGGSRKCTRACPRSTSRSLSSAAACARTSCGSIPPRSAAPRSQLHWEILFCSQILAHKGGQNPLLGRVTSLQSDFTGRATCLQESRGWQRPPPPGWQPPPRAAPSRAPPHAPPAAAPPCRRARPDKRRSLAQPRGAGGRGDTRCVSTAPSNENLFWRSSPRPRTKWTRRVPHPVLIGHVASLTPY